MIDLMVLGVVKLMERRLCRLVDGSMHHMVSTVNVQKTMPQQVSVVSTTKVTVHKILSLVSNAANSPNKVITIAILTSSTLLLKAEGRGTESLVCIVGRRVGAENFS